MNLKQQKRIKKEAAHYLSLKTLKEKLKFIEYRSENNIRKNKRLTEIIFINFLVICFLIGVIFFYSYMIYSILFK